MKIIERYLLAEFARVFLMALAGFIVLFLVVDLFENMDDIMAHGVPFGAATAFFALKVPFVIAQVSPVSVLLATLLSIGTLSRHDEITAMKAGGVRVLRAALPLFVAGLAISAAVLLLNESVTPAAVKKAESMKRRWAGFETGSLGPQGMWVKTSEGIYNVRQADLAKGVLNGVTLYSIERPFSVTSSTHARTVELKDGRWVAPKAAVWTFKAGAARMEKTGLAMEGLPGPEDLSDVENIHRNMGFLELRQYVRSLEAEGYGALRHKIELYGKLTFPLVNFIMVFVGIPFALKTGRSSGIAAGIGLSVAIGFSYWIVFAVMKAIGQGGLLPPLLAAAFPDVLFFAIGALMLGYVRE